ncbi:MAG: ABC-2 family transporter protein [Elusimicrobia bacterium]|nr:ABC-2 family transporter protein [Elusimicrobiota bacterium]
MQKYLSVFFLSLEQELYHRASFLMDRARSITILIAFYAFWSTIFQDRATLLGYTKSQMFTYVLGMNVLRALVFSDKTWEIIREINTGKISAYLIRPISYVGYSISRDLSDKALSLSSAIMEVLLAILVLSIPLYLPQHGATFLAFIICVTLAILLYFLMSYAVSALAFWTAESAGPRFCFELFIEFAAGAFFPLDVLPIYLRNLFEALPFASLLFFPLNILLERISPSQILKGLLIQLVWIFIFAFITRMLWKKGLESYGAEGG